ncbi:MAG: hypothetical protein ACI8QG_000065 [Flavobacteriales bacterium]|jgi:hypothetical protein
MLIAIHGLFHTASMLYDFLFAYSKKEAKNTARGQCSSSKYQVNLAGFNWIF